MIIVIGIFALFYFLLGLWIAIQIFKGKRIRWPIGRNEGRKMFEGWVATRKQLIANIREAFLENGTVIVVDEMNQEIAESRDKIPFNLWSLIFVQFSHEWVTRGNSGLGFTSTGEEIH